jgi:hypothetical protein
MDLCHPNNPNCVTGVTCADCQAGFNPHFIISGNLVSFSNSLSIPTEIAESSYTKMELLPNPAIDRVTLTTNRNNAFFDADVSFYNMTGHLMKEVHWNGDALTVDVSGFRDGMYIVAIQTGKGTEMKKLIIRK